MNLSSVLKWLAAVVAAGAVAALKVIAAKIGIPGPGVDSVVGVVIAAVVVKIVNWLVGKLPADA